MSTLGARENTPQQVEIFSAAMENITRAMKEHDVRRLVAISGAAVLLPDDHVSLGRRLVKRLLTLVAKHIAAAKQREADIIRATDLEWVLVRPPRIVRGERTGRYRVLSDRVPSARISQGDVADLVLRGATGDEWVRSAPIPGC